MFILRLFYQMDNILSEWVKWMCSAQHHISACCCVLILWNGRKFNGIWSIVVHELPLDVHRCVNVLEVQGSALDITQFPRQNQKEDEHLAECWEVVVSLTVSWIDLLPWSMELVLTSLSASQCIRKHLQAERTLLVALVTRRTHRSLLDRSGIADVML